MNILSVIKEVLSPGQPEFRAHLTRMKDEEVRLLKCLHYLEQPATQQIKASTDEAAEFNFDVAH